MSFLNHRQEGQDLVDGGKGEASLGFLGVEVRMGGIGGKGH